MSVDQRRHDLDALRAFAMCLGIGLHASMAYWSVPWIVQDRFQNEFFHYLFDAIHGFRMHLFFLVSGFFTALFWQRKGTAALLKQRAKRILFPFIISLITILPASRFLTAWAYAITSPPATPNRPLTPEDEMVNAIRQQRRSEIQALLKRGLDVQGRDSQFNVSLLAWAALADDLETATLLIENGAYLEVRNGDGSTALQSAAFLGRKRIVELLLKNGANANAQSNDRKRPLDVLSTDLGATNYIADVLQLPKIAKNELESGRDECRELLENAGARSGIARVDLTQTEPQFSRTIRAEYLSFLISDRFLLRITEQGTPIHLILTPLLDFLWFLWFLLWLLPLFLIVAITSQRITKFFGYTPKISIALILGLCPLTMLPQLLMGVFAPSFGPDTSLGIIPQPHLLAFYGIFFAFGALYYFAEDHAGKLGRWWWGLLPFSLLILFPTALWFQDTPFNSGIFQVAYAWCMSLAMIGVFRRFLSHPSSWIRYLSDASYWLYLTHLPVVLFLQIVIRNINLPAALKFSVVFLSAFAVLLIIYHLLVRRTFVGLLLNGKRN